jgi:hypothetical protein
MAPIWIWWMLMSISKKDDLKSFFYKPQQLKHDIYQKQSEILVNTEKPILTVR